MITEKIKNIIIETISPYKPRSIEIFGSYSRGENEKDSDLDILVNFEKTINLLDLIGLEQELSEKLGIKVDLITKRSLHKEFKKYIKKDLTTIYE